MRHGYRSLNGLGGAGGAVIVPETSFTTTLAPGMPHGTYQVRVIGLSGTGQVVGTFSDAVTLILGPGDVVPAIIPPVPGQSVLRGAPVTFVWTARIGAAPHFIEFTGPNRQFADPNGTTTDPVSGLGGAGGGFPVPGTSLTIVIPAAIARQAPTRSG